jgi:hypothetical protein
VHEIAAMRVGGNAKMMEWWKSHGVDPKGSIQSKYSHPETQNYREKIKADIAGKEYVAPKKSESAVRKSPKSKTSSKKKSSRSKLNSSQNSTGQMFSFEDNNSAKKTPHNDDSDDSFEGFVTAPKTVHQVPDYSDSRLNKYEGNDLLFFLRG